MNVRRGRPCVAIGCLGMALAARSLARSLGQLGEPTSAEQARAWKAFAREFDEQVRPREDDARAPVRQVAGSKPGRWRFFQGVLPYSRTPAWRL